VIVALGLVIADFGARSYLIQAAEVSAEQRRSAFGASLFMAVLTYAATAAICFVAPPSVIAPEVRSAVLALSTSLLVHPVGMTAAAMLQRKMRFGALYVVVVASAGLGNLVAVLLAWRGAGYMSPVWGALTEAVSIAVIGSFYVRPVLPSLRRPREVLSFGWVWTCIAGLKEAGELAERMIVASLIGLTGVGLVSRAQTVVGLMDLVVMSALNPVALPALSERVRSGRPLGDWYVHQFALLSALCWPVFGFIALYAEPLVLLILGDQWRGAIPLVRWLCIAGIFIPPSALAVDFLVALGAVRAYLPRQLFVQVATTASVLAGALVSLQAAAAALALEGAFKTLAIHDLIRRHVQPSGRAMAEALVQGVGLTVFSLVGPLAVAIAQARGMLDLWSAFFLAAALAAVSWLLGAAFGGLPIGRELRRGVSYLAAIRAGSARG
jgi:O-antigen/teichoic acid export membrane protein